MTTATTGRLRGPGDEEDQERSEHDEVAMGEVDQAHDAEDQRQTGGVERVEAAEEHALDDGIDGRGHAVRFRNRRRGWRHG